jgi:hypothetical protein
VNLWRATVVCFAAIVLAIGGTAHSREAVFQTPPLAKSTPCNSPGACLAKTNKGSGAAIEGISLEPNLGSYGQAAILARSKGIGGVYSFSRSSYGGEFESDGKGYALIAASDNPQGIAFLAESTSDSTSPAILALSKSPEGPAIVAQGPGDGIDATSLGGYAASFTTTGAYGVAVSASNKDSRGALFLGEGSYGEAFLVDTKGDGDFGGTVNRQGLCD